MFWPRRNPELVKSQPDTRPSFVLHVLHRGQVICFIICCCCFLAGPCGASEIWLPHLDKYATAALLNRIGDFNLFFGLCCVVLGLITFSVSTRSSLLLLLAIVLLIIYPSYGVA